MKTIFHRLLIKQGRFFPLYLVVGYVAFTYALFLWGPLDWTVDNAPAMHLFIGACLAAMSGAYYFGARGKLAHAPQLPWKRFYYVGCIASVILLFPGSYLYTNLWPWDVFAMFRCQNTAYMNMLGMSLDPVDGRQWFALLRGMLAPFTISVVPIAVLHWSLLRWREHVLLVLYLASVVCMSYLRGTDKENADIFIMLLALLPLITYRATVRHNVRGFFLLKFVAVIAVLAVLFGVQFAERKDARLNRSYPTIIAYHDKSCPIAELSCMCKREKETIISAATRQQTLAAIDLGDRFSKAYAKQVEDSKQAQAGSKYEPRTSDVPLYVRMLSTYLGQGYFGMSLAMNEPFTSTYGVGHSPLLLQHIGEQISPEFKNRTYTEKISAKGWSSTYRWSTLFTWLANDVSFWGVPFLLAIFAWVLAKAWRQATEQADDIASIIYMMMVVGIFYIPANNQIMLTIDSYASLLFWLGYWLVMRYRATR